MRTNRSDKMQMRKCVDIQTSPAVNVEEQICELVESYHICNYFIFCNATNRNILMWQSDLPRVHAYIYLISRRFAERCWVAGSQSSDKETQAWKQCWIEMAGGGSAPRNIAMCQKMAGRKKSYVSQCKQHQFQRMKNSQWRKCAKKLAQWMCATWLLGLKATHRAQLPLNYQIKVIATYWRSK